MTHSHPAMMSTPNALATRTGVQILKDGGNAVEATIAAAATMAVVYPHMNGLGGDGFWLIMPPHQPPVAIRACGPAALTIDASFYQHQGFKTIPTHGPLAANTVAGVVSGWQFALEYAKRMGGQCSLAQLFEEAIYYAEFGAPIQGSLQRSLTAKHATLKDQPHWLETFGTNPTELKQPALADTFKRLTLAGLEDFYRGKLARELSADLQKMGSPLCLEDLNRFEASWVDPVRLSHSKGSLYNLPPPTQGLVSLLILGILDQLPPHLLESEINLAQAIVEATKLAFELRDSTLSDPQDYPVDDGAVLSRDNLTALASRIDFSRSAPFGDSLGPGDTVWMGCCDRHGWQVSYIQSIYHEFGSGCVLPNTGVLWQNRGCAFSLNPQSIRALRPGKLPFHTLNPAGARLNDGRSLVYGSMGGDGQPQTQAQIFLRYLKHGDPQAAIDSPRWVLGRTWGDASNRLKLERRFDSTFVDDLRSRGHAMQWLEEFDDAVGHAGMVVRRADGSVIGASDPRSDGAAVGVG